MTGAHGEAEGNVWVVRRTTQLHMIRESEQPGYRTVTDSDDLERGPPYTPGKLSGDPTNRGDQNVGPVDLHRW